MQLRIAELIATHELVIADGTLVGVANYAGCASRSEFAGTAAYGYCAAKSQYVWGVRLVLMTDRRACRSATRSSPPTRRSTSRCASSRRALRLHADRRQGLLGPRLQRDARAARDQPPHSRRVRTADNLAREKRLAGIRLVIESTIANLKGQMRLERHLAKTPAGSRSGSRNASSRSPSACSSTPSPADHAAASSPMTAAKPTSSL